ncbi:MAG: RNA-binding protein [Planctomycetota bacterium]|jgi:RNA-binding protein
MPLNKSQIKNLRAEAHRSKLKPVVTVGQNGLSENVHTEIENAVNHHELLKLRIPALEKADKAELTRLICQKHQAELIQAIGSVIIIYRRNEKIAGFDKLTNA